jgi:hypothetical protein
MSQFKFRNSLVWALCLLLLSSAVRAEPLCVDSANPQYFVRGTTTTALVGASAEYICHVPMSGASFVGNYCTYHNNGYRGYIDNLALKGLNVFQLWIVLNHSPGRALNGGVIFPNEQPFHLNAQGKWSHTVGQYDTMFFSHVYDVISYAQTKNVFVEVVLFDPWQGPWQDGPWNSANIVNGPGFQNESDFVTLVNESCSSSGARLRQKAIMKHLASTLYNLDNFYYQIANEPDIDSGNPVTGAQVAAWHDCMIQELYNHEASLGSRHHVIGVNYQTTQAIDTIKNNTYPSSSPRVKVMNAHYPQVKGSDRVGAIELIRNYNNGPSGNLNRLYGFNETHITPSITPGSPQVKADVNSARVEAWEFMMHEGGIYDHLGYQWTSAAGQTVRTQLGKLATFINGFNLMTMRRSPGNPPSWLPFLPAYGSSDGGAGGAKIFWGALESSQARVLYLHHSKLLDDNPPPSVTAKFHKYDPPSSINKLTSVTVNPPGTGSYYARWIQPSDTTQLGATVTIPGGVNTTLSVPAYSRDIALVVTPTIGVIISRSCANTCCAAN